MTRRLPTMADLRAEKGRRQRTMLRCVSLQDAGAAEAVGIDIASVPPDLLPTTVTPRANPSSILTSPPRRRDSSANGWPP